MALSGNEPFSDLKDRITSPGGTTIAGLQIMEQAGLRGILMDTVQAAVLTSRRVRWAKEIVHPQKISSKDPHEFQIFPQGLIILIR